MNLNLCQNLKELTWEEEVRSALRTQEELEQFLEVKLPNTGQKIFIPKKYAIIVKKSGEDSPLWRQFVPSKLENCSQTQTSGMLDPIGDEKYTRAPQVIHRYKNRALFMPTQICPINCRYCFRKNELAIIPNTNLKESLKYLEEHTEINEIIFSGGDPFILSNDKLDFLLGKLLTIKHIKHIRFHSRVPVILPSRINNEFISLIKNYSEKFTSFSIAIHTNHVTEWNQENITSLKKLATLNVQLLSQSVLLRNINDSTSDLYNLFNFLIENQVRPYYLHHPDKTKGAMHFYLSLEEGRKIFQPLRNFLPGWAIAQYIIDLPNGEGKTQAFNPEKFDFSGKFINKNGDLLSI